MNRPTLVVKLSIAMSAALLVPATLSVTAVAAESSESTQIPVIAAPTSDVPAGMTLAKSFPQDWVGSMPESVRRAAAELETSRFWPQVNNLEWIDESHTLVAYVYGDSSGVKRMLNDLLPVSQRTQIIATVNSKEHVQKSIRDIVGESGQLPSGHRVATAVPAKDGSSIAVTIVSSGEKTDVSRALRGVHSDIPVSVLAGERPVAALRAAGAPMVSGAYMHGQGKACTTGFPIIQKSTTQYGFLSADHCGETVAEPWYYGLPNTVLVGNTTGQASGGGDHEVFRGASVTNMTAYSFIAGYQNNASVAPIKGYFTAPLGDKVCMNGAFSGIVCNNTVIATGAAVCYDGVQCYYLVSYTHQDADIPSVGHGDSGGPVMRVEVGGNVHGGGIISGMTLATENCTGEQDRECSSYAIFSPLNQFATYNSDYAFLVVP